MAAKRETVWDHYQRYRAWCLLLGVEPAAFHIWRNETARIFSVDAEIYRKNPKSHTLVPAS